MGWKLRGSDSRSRGLSVIFVPTALPGAFIVEIDRRADDRGFFARTWCRREDGERRRRATLPSDPAALRTLPAWTRTPPVPSHHSPTSAAPRWWTRTSRGSCVACSRRTSPTSPSVARGSPGRSPESCSAHRPRMLHTDAVLPAVQCAMRYTQIEKQIPRCAGDDSATLSARQDQLSAASRPDSQRIARC